MSNNIQTSYFNTHTDVIEFEHKWVIENMINIYDEFEKTMSKLRKTDLNTYKTKIPYLKTKFVPVGLKAKNYNIKFKLYCYPFGTCKENNEYMSLFLKLDSCFISNVTIQYKLSVLDKKGNKFYVKGKKLNNELCKNFFEVYI